MGTKTFWVLTTLLVVVIWWFFFFFNGQAGSQNLEPVAPKYWSDTGDFIYTGSTTSSFLWWEAFFVGEKQIENVKTLESVAHGKPRFYIEYPNFKELQNREILSAIRKKILHIYTSTPKTQTGAENLIGYRADFVVLTGNNLGSIVYTITQEDTGKNPKEIAKQVYIMNEKGEIVDPKLLLDESKKQEGISIIVGAFQENFPNFALYDASILDKNLENWLETGHFAFSGSNIVFYGQKSLFGTGDTKNSDNCIFEIPYENLKSFILTAPKKVETPITNAQWVTKSSDGKKYVALTFDDGPHWKYTGYLLDTLKTKGVHATFFVLWENAERYPEIIAREKTEWHEIGSHSWDHPSFLKLSNATQIMQISKTDYVLMRETGEKATLFRPPYGAYNKNTLKNVEKTFVMWSVDSRDWKNRNVEKNIATTMSQVYDGSIILFHDIHKESIESIPALIDKLRAQGYEFLTVSELYKKYHNDETLLPEQVCFSMKKCN